ncbi:MAG: hypothetical protein IPK26_15640 [Planctomycetes bacterium]|nr:hypothetical protein [Planctomycetota bacterium]
MRLGVVDCSFAMAWVFQDEQNFGSSGMALAVAQPILVGSDDELNRRADVYMGTLMFHCDGANHQANAAAPDNAFGAIVWLEWNGSSLAQHMVKVLDGSSANNPVAYGVCGVAVGDVIRNNGVKELVVTTMDGQLLVFTRNSQGHVGQLLLRERLEGSIAPYNSLVVGDLDPMSPGEEVYVAGSLGVRKFKQP